MRSPSSLITPLALSLALAFSTVPLLSGCDQNSRLSAEEHIERAKDFQSKGNARSSVLELKNAVQKDPNNAQARWLLGTIYLDMRLGSDAETQLRKAVELGISPQSARIPIARAQLYQGNFQNILDTLPAVDEDEPGLLAQILDLRGNALLGLGKYDEGCSAFERAIQVDANFASAYLGRARCKYKEGQPGLALESAKHAAALDPSHLNAWYLQGDLHRTLNQTDEALAAYNRALEIQPDDFDALTFKALTLLSVQKNKEAEDVIKRLEKLRPQAPQTNYLNAYLFHLQGKNTEAANLLQRVIKDAPNNPQAQLLYGTINYALKNDEIALSSLNKALVLTEIPEARILLAATQLRMGSPADAVKTLTPILVEGSNPKAYLLAGQAMLNQGEIEKGMAYLSRASSMAPKDMVIRSALAQNQLLTGDQQGIRGLESVITDNPEDTQAYLLLAANQFGKADYKGALSTLQKMAAAQPGNPLSHVLIGRVHLMQKNPVAARQAFERSLTVDAGFLPAVGALVDLDMQEKKSAQARERFKKVLSTAPNNLGALMGQARTALALGDQNEFVAYMKMAVERHPDAHEPVSRLTVYYIKQAGKPELALEVAQKAARANSGNPAFLDNLGQAQLGAGRKKDAVDTYTRITNHLPNSAIAWYRLGWAQRVAGDLNAALKSLQKSVRLDANNLDARIALAGLYAALGKQDEALLETRAIQALNPQSPAGYNLEAELSARFEQPEASLQALARAHEKAATSETAATYHLALMRAAKRDQAEQLAQQWLKLHPGDSAFRIYLAGAYLHQQKPDLAIAQYQQVLKSQPGHVLALNNVAALLMEKNDPSAYEFARRAYSLQPSNPVVMDTHGWGLLKQGKLQEALPLLKQAAQAIPDSPSVQYHWATALANSGDETQARALLKKLLASQQRFSERGQASTLLKNLEVSNPR